MSHQGANRRLIMLRSLCPVLLLLVPSVAVAQTSKLAVLPTQFDETARGLVPDLFDDYLLTALQNMGQYEVIGQDDISALLNFEEQKDLLDCNDTTCIADIGGALGVDKLVAVKIARLHTDWVATGKLINIKETRVEARVNEIVSGDVKTLLQSVNPLVVRLFQKAGENVVAPSTSTQRAAPSSSQAATTTAQGAPLSLKTTPAPNLGAGQRVAGIIMMIGGAVGWTVGAAMLTGAVTDAQAGWYYASPSSAYGSPLYWTGTLFFVAGQVIQGIGAKIRANGAAKRDLANPDAWGKPAVYWLGWVLGAVSWGSALLTPALGEISDGMVPLGLTAGWLSAIASTTVFMIGGFGVSTPYAGSSAPMPTVGYAQVPGGPGAPTVGMGFNF